MAHTFTRGGRANGWNKYYKSKTKRKVTSRDGSILCEMYGAEYLQTLWS